MENQQNVVSVLNDLIEINNDRADGFENASENLNDANVDLKAIFDKLGSESRSNSIKLAGLVGGRGDKPESGNSISGTLHRAWIDVKATFGGDDRHSILAECERGENAIRKAYKDALQENELGNEVRDVLLDQQKAVNAGHDTIKALRDAQKVVD